VNIPLIGLEGTHRTTVLRGEGQEVLLRKLWQRRRSQDAADVSEAQLGLVEPKFHHFLVPSLM
jgi:hypothetical protein